MVSGARQGRHKDLRVSVPSVPRHRLAGWNLPGKLFSRLAGRWGWKSSQGVAALFLQPGCVLVFVRAQGALVTALAVYRARQGAE